MIKLDDKKILIVSSILSVLALLSGVIYMMSQWAFYESGHGILLIIYAIACFAAFFALRFVNTLQIIGAIILLGLILFYADLKFEWQRDYYDNARHGTPFILEPYIDNYPTLEQHHFGWIWGAPRPVAFTNDCIIPHIKGHSVSGDCKSAQNIRDTYNIDPLAMVNTHFRAMKNTAQRIESGRLSNKKQYQACLENKSCAIIPLLPADVDPQSISQQSQDYILTRKMFWSLVNDPQISPEICDYIDLCRILRDMGIMPIEKPKPISTNRS